jgi:hypothetical protein
MLANPHVSECLNIILDTVACTTLYSKLIIATLEWLFCVHLSSSGAVTFSETFVSVYD